jgi:DNA modification methylase
MAEASRWRIIEGDVDDVLRSLETGSIHTCVTSPPYFGLRDYGAAEQIGLEPTPDEYVDALVAVFRGVRRVLRDDGTVWLNLGDSYNADGRKGRAHMGEGKNNGYSAWVNKTMAGTKPKDLLGIPWMVAFALRADGWYLRSDIIWSKPNPMPESVTDRPTKAHEYVFLLSKGPRYFYDADAIREPHESEPGNQARQFFKGDSGHSSLQLSGRGTVYHEHGRNKRSVWTVATQPYAGAHFATFPPKLIEPCILAGAPERACGECGAPWVRVVERTPMVVEPSAKRAGWQATDEHARTQTGGTMTQAPTSRTVGFEANCEHNDGSAAGVVLDPFAGSGTTGMVALRHARSFVGVELNPAYAALARERIIADAPLLNSPTEAAA